MNPSPLIAITLGDPCGIGPEVVAKAIGAGDPHRVCRPLVVGSIHAMESGCKVAGIDWRVRRVEDESLAGTEPGVIDVLDSGCLDPAEIEPGIAKASCGRANGAWLEEASRLVASGRAAAHVMAPVNAAALAMSGRVRGLPRTDPAALYLTLLSGPLRVVHVFDHVALEDVCRELSYELVLAAVRRVAACLEGWGLPKPRIGVAGLNPHAQGRQERDAIAPAVRTAMEEGLRVAGPIAPDTVFRHCIEGRYDVVLAMYHDQGHIAVKTWGFGGNCALFLGAPQLFLSVGHGTAYDIVGRGIADHAMLQSAILQAASLASGRGFLS